MQRNQKYHSNYFSQSNLHEATYLPPQAFSRIDMKISPRPQLVRQIPMIKQQKQNSIILRNSPFQNQYSFMSRYNKQDQFSGMQTYLSSIYGQKKQKRRQQQYSFQQREQRFRQQNLVLPAILIKRNQCIKDRQTEQMKRFQQLEDRFSKLAMGCNRFQHNGCYMNGHQQQQCNGNHQCNGNQQCSANQYGNKGVHKNSIQQQQQQQQPQNQNQKKNKQPRQSQKPKSQPKPQKPKVSPQRRKKILSRFRVIGYAVYFAVIFPHYSYLFGHFKLKQFLSKYLVEQNSYIRHMNLQLQQKFKQIPLYEHIRQIHQKYEQQNDLVEKKNRQQDPKIKISNSITNQNYIINLNIFKRIMQMMLTTYNDFVDKLNQEQLQFLGVGVLNTSYYGDQIYSIEQMPFINCHQQKGNIRVNKKQEKALMLSNFIIKRIVYQNLVRLAVDPQWHQQMATYSALKKHEVQFFKIICKQIQLAALLIYQMAIKNFYLLIDSQQQGNFLDLTDSALPLPLKTMRFPTLFMTGSQKDIFNHGFDNYLQRQKKQKVKKPIQGPYKINDKKNRHNQNNNNNNNNNKKNNNNVGEYGSVDRFEQQYDWSTNQKEIFDQYQQLIQEDPLNIIHNNTQFAQLSTIISQYMKSSYEKQQKSMMKIIQKLSTKIYQKKRKNYKKYHERVMRKKYILTKQHEILQGVVFLRNQEQKKLVAISRHMLELYQQTLEDHQYEVRDQVGDDFNSKRQLMKQNHKNSNKNKGKIGSMVSIVTGQNQTKSSFYGQSSQVSYKRSK